LSSRQFQYALRALHRLSEWEVSEQRQHLAAAVDHEQECEARLNAVRAACQHAEAAVRAASGQNALLDPHHRALWLRHLGSLDRQNAAAQQRMDRATEDKEAALAELGKRHSFLKGLEVHRDQQAAAFAKELQKQEANMLDEAWLQLTSYQGGHHANF
jgi:multidrug resistance efflux pump